MIATLDLLLLNSYPLLVPEPSGLTLDSEGGFWTVSDQSGLLYHLGPQGEVLASMSCSGTDLEGIAFDSLRQVLWVVDEASARVIRLDLEGNELGSIHLASLDGDTQHGLEGLCIDASRLWLLKEKLPGLLIQVDAEGELLSSQNLDFADDYSAIDRDLSGDLWILSDESNLLAHCDSQGVLQHAYDLPFSKPEGLALDFASRRIWIVSDSQEKLYEFEMP
jgi:uncharacterized protein YjiK